MGEVSNATTNVPTIVLLVVCSLLTVTTCLPLSTRLFDVVLLDKKFTIDALRPKMNLTTNSTMSFACSASSPIDRTGPKNHGVGDVSLRIKSTAASNVTTVISMHSIHCTAPDKGQCIVNSLATSTPRACGAACGVDVACAAWSWAHTGTCYLLSNATAAMISDPNADCGSKPSWPHSDSSIWKMFSSATASPPIQLNTPPGELFAVDLNLNYSGLCVSRHLLDDDGDLRIRFDLFNIGTEAIVVGAFGWAMIWDQLFTSRTLDEIALQGSFNDPSINGDAGYVQVVSTTGTGPVLLILPEPPTIHNAATTFHSATNTVHNVAPVVYNENRNKKGATTHADMLGDGVVAGVVSGVDVTGVGDKSTSDVLHNGSAGDALHNGFEAWRLLTEDPDVTFEGFYEMMTHSQAYASEWKAGGGPFNAPTYKTILGGATYSISFRMTLAPSLRDIDTTLLAHNRPVFSAVPGYMLTSEMRNASLTVTHQSPGFAIESIALKPLNCLATQDVTRTRETSRKNTRAPKGSHSSSTKLQLTPLIPGRCRITFTFNDASTSFVHYFNVLESASQHGNSNFDKTSNQQKNKPRL